MRKTNKILWFVYDFNAPGGGERWILEAVNVFKNNGVNTQIICENFDKKVFFNGKYLAPVKVLSKRQIHTNKLLSKLVGFLSLIVKLRKEIRKTNSQMVLSQGFREYVIVFFATMFTSAKYSIIDFGQIYQIQDVKIKYSFFYKSKLKEINTSIRNCGEQTNNDWAPKTVLKKIENEIKGLLLYLAFKNTYQIFTLSEKVQREDLLLYDKKSTVIKCAFNETIFEKIVSKKSESVEKEDTLIIFTVGRLVSHKRVDLCLKAINILRLKMGNFIFYIGGQGPEMNNLQRLTKELGIEKHVKFLGFINESELLNYYYACDVFTTMDSADFDITPYVALALGKKVVWPKIMEIDDNLKNNRHLFPALPHPKYIADCFEMALNTNVGFNNREEEVSLRKYTYEANFFNMLKIITI